MDESLVTPPRSGPDANFGRVHHGGKRGCEWRNDRSGAVLIAHVVLDDQDRTATTLLVTDDGIEIGKVNFASLAPPGLHASFSPQVVYRVIAS